jgi:hypothetical protein
MNEGVYVKCDQYAGWSVVARDEWGNEQPVITGAPTMEEALRQATMSSGRPHYLKLTLG